jgi:hypothetical protein
MASDHSVPAPSDQEELPIGRAALHRRAFDNARYVLAAQAAAERDMRFFLHVAHSNEAVTASLKSSLAKIAESKALLAKVNNLLRR